MIIEGQVHGGLTDGIGMALMEMIAFDEDGNCLGGSFMDYLIPTALEVPHWETGHTVTPSPHHPIGAKGDRGVGHGRLAAGDRQRGRRRAQAVRRPARRHAAHPVAGVGRHAGPGDAADLMRRHERDDSGWPARVDELPPRAASRSCTRRWCGRGAADLGHAGDDAIVLADGTIEGFVGGAVRRGVGAHGGARRCSRDGEPLLLRIAAGGRRGVPRRPRAQVVVNPCLSGGALEIFLEPQLPAPIVAVVGTTPTAVALASLASAVGLEATTSENLAGSALEGVTAVVVASHGHHEEESIRAALDAGVPYIGLVASKKRGGAVIDVMDLSKDELARVHSPVGIDIGARSAEEIALSILADVVRAIRIDAIAPSRSGQPLPAPTAVDPVCGMTVVVGADTAHAVVDGQDYWFCCPGCRDKFVA